MPKEAAGEWRPFYSNESRVNKYLQGPLEAATEHLKGRVSAERLQMLKEVIAMRLETDPLLVEARARVLDDANHSTGRGSKSDR